MKLGLTGKPPETITVVEFDPDQKRALMQHAVGRRYRSLLGITDAGRRTDGFQGWIADPRL